MSTDLYLVDPFTNKEGAVENTHFTDNDSANRIAEAIDAELTWLMNEIIKPDLPNIIDNVDMCIDLLQNDQIFKMPLSNGAKEADSSVPFIKGIISRKKEHIVDFQVMIKFPDFNNGKVIVLRMTPNTKFLLNQFDLILENLKHIMSLLNTLGTVDDVHQFIVTFTSIVELLNNSINLSNSPPSDLTYPNNNNLPMKEIFSNYESVCDTPTNLIALELILNKNELCVDFRNLYKVKRKPWANIDPETGKCFIDKIKDELTSDRSRTIKDVLKENNITVEESNLINNLISSTFKSDTTTTLTEAQDFLRRGTTFDGIAVLEGSKIVISTSDPTLICISSKLNGLKYFIDDHYNNLKIHHH